MLRRFLNMVGLAVGLAAIGGEATRARVRRKGPSPTASSRSSTIPSPARPLCLPTSRARRPHPPPAAGLARPRSPTATSPSRSSTSRPARRPDGRAPDDQRRALLHRLGRPGRLLRAGADGPTVFFGVAAHGYEFPKDGFGIRGVVLEPKPGGSARSRSGG